MRRAFVFAIPFAWLAAACTYDNGDARHVLDDTPPVSCTTPTSSNIDTDVQLDVDKGIGAGVFIEYASGGHWHVRTSCDTLRSNTSCHWDVIITPQTGTTISNPAGENLGPNDSFQPYPASADQPDAPLSYDLIAETTTDISGVTFDADAGSPVTVDAYLDNTCALPFFFWSGDGAVHKGSPSNPLTLQPSSE